MKLFNQLTNFGIITTKYYEEVLRECQIEVETLQLLLVLDYYAKISVIPTQTTLCELTHTNRQTMVRRLNKLEASNLTIRKSDEKDKRVKLIYMTKDGEAKLQQVNDGLSNIERKLELNIGSEKYQNHVKNLTNFIQDLEIYEQK